MAKKKSKPWYEYMYILSILYLGLGIFNILFAWLGMLCFTIPLLISAKGGGKTYCNKYCGRGQLFHILGREFKLSRDKPMPNFMKSYWFRYGFLAFFMTMFSIMIFNTYLVFSNTKDLNQVVTLLWSWKLPWEWVDTSIVSPWIAQFAFGFYSVMLTSTVIGIITMLLYKPRSWCVYCPMGTMTQGISTLKHKKQQKL